MWPNNLIKFDREKFSETWKYRILRDLHNFELKKRLPEFYSNWSNRTLQVHIGFTLIKKSQEGVPLGSILFVTLFNIEINHITKELSPDIKESSKNIHTIKRNMWQYIAGRPPLSQPPKLLMAIRSSSGFSRLRPGVFQISFRTHKTQHTQPRG